MSSPGSDRLESWKEIASLIGRDERTAMRWAKEQGMPIHRAPGLKRGRIFASRSELKHWMESRSTASAEFSSGNLLADGATAFDGAVPPHVASDLTEGQRDGAPLGRAAFSSGSRLMLIAAVAAAGALTFAIFLRERAPSELHVNGFVQLTDDGRRKQFLRAYGDTLYFDELEGVHEVLAEAPTQGGEPRLIATPFTNVELQDVSNDGKSLLVTSYEGAESDRKLWVLPLGGGSPQRVGEIVARLARWSPDNQRMAYSHGPVVSVAAVDGGQTQVVGTYRGQPRRLVWSPDGTRLRFQLWSDSAFEPSAWEAVLTSGKKWKIAGVRRLSVDADCCADWTWTRDGRQFVYLLSSARSGSRLVVESESAWQNWFESKPAIPVNIGFLDGLTPGGNSQSLYLLASSTERGEFLKYNSRDEQFETYLPGVSGHYLSYSRDGKWIAHTNPAGEALWRCRADGSDELRLSPAEVQVQLSSWSPNGVQIAFMGKVAGKPWRIFLIGKDGGAAVEAASGDDEQGAPSWSPDGRFLVYGNVYCQETRTCGIRRIDLKTRESRVIPGSEGFRTARWSPDGRYIAALQPELHNVMLYEVATQRWHILAGATTGDDLNWSHDSQFLFVDSFQGDKPIIDRLRIRDGERSSVVGVSSLQRMPGSLSVWFGLAPDDSPVLLHLMTSSEVYGLNLSGP